MKVYRKGIEVINIMKITKGINPNCSERRWLNSMNVNHERIIKQGQSMKVEQGVNPNCSEKYLRE